MIRELLAWSLIAAVLLASGAAWWRFARTGPPLLRDVERAVRPVPWFFLDLCVALLMLLSAVHWVGPPPEDPQPALWTGFLLRDTLAQLLWPACMVAVLTAVRHARLEDFGYWRQGRLRDVLLGAQLFAMAAPALYGLQWVLVNWWPKQHPLMELLAQVDDRRLWLVAFVRVVLAAPISEEFTFRVLVQGWLEKIFYRAAWLSGRWTRHWGPVLISSVLFSAAHAGHGPAWISIFFLALLLGYVYRKTHSVLPCLVIHGLLNAVSFVLLMLVGTGAK
ncbi:MAG: hypothetical protein KatS3mg110_4180 [Pirellulaceae bacterium]|nr:MAG: hypothetical protein KatS3mg110_4180 [Pirellulaceae bacterium]